MKKIGRRCKESCATLYQNTSAFSSRVHGRHLRKFSDLGLVVCPKESLSWQRIGKLKDAFEYSDLPIRVDVLDLSDVSEEFRQIVLKEHQVVQEAQ